ncbi:hypothetical protein Tcan_09630 [Toxocara canis]|uniref:Uncharacterized protein n=1 Tax=Toxocara canis TaxID=6265 RepID=A0A0B2V988_TOXCA|nr:hypothetical protein Tcan_09630 [Toxocara canis]
MTPWSGVIYLLDSFCFSYDVTLSPNDVISEIDWFFTITINSLSFIVYLSIFIIIVKKRRAHHLQFNRKELRLLLHSFIIYVWVLFIIFTFHDYSLLLPPSQWTYFAISIIWILYCGLSPMLYIVFNSSKKNCREIFPKWSRQAICYIAKDGDKF